MKEESNCFGLIIWIRAPRGYTHLKSPFRMEGWRGGGYEEEFLVPGKDSLASIFQHKAHECRPCWMTAEFKSCLLCYFHLYSSSEMCVIVSVFQQHLASHSYKHTFSHLEAAQSHASTGIYQAAVKGESRHHGSIYWGHYSFILTFPVLSGFGNSNKSVTVKSWFKSQKWHTNISAWMFFAQHVTFMLRLTWI